MGKLTFTFDIDPDEHGVYDGRELAEQFINAAFQVLVPYVDGCPACADTLMSAIANRVMGELHDEGRKEGKLPRAYFALGEQADKWDRINAHLAASKEETAAIMGVTSEGHTHH
jgi:hypothetical protein